MKKERLYSAPEVRSAMTACGTGAAGLRDAALINVLWCSGLRCAEALALLPGDVDRKRGTVWVSLGKGGVSRLVVLPGPMTEELWTRLDAWMNVRPADAERLFCNLNGAPLEGDNVRGLFRSISERLGLEGRFHPHALRHNFASKMHLSGIALDIIQQQLGHAELTVTGVYLRHIEDEVLLASVVNAPLR